MYCLAPLLGGLMRSLRFLKTREYCFETEMNYADGSLLKVTRSLGEIFIYGESILGICSTNET